LLKKSTNKIPYVASRLVSGWQCDVTVYAEIESVTSFSMKARVIKVKVK
jgi:hypothetical protein